jgi:putative hemolysin
MRQRGSVLLICALTAVLIGVTTPRPAGASLATRGASTTVPPGEHATGELVSVSCPSELDCVGVGQNDEGSVAPTPLAAQWDGKAWRSILPVQPRSSSAALHGVSCTSSTHCFAVGTAGGRSLVELWDGQSWRIVSSPGSQPLNSVACPKPTFCMAAGGEVAYSYDANTFAQVEVWEGGSWEPLTVPRPASWNGSSLFGVSCTGTSNCMAVGYSYTLSAHIGMLAEHWDGSTWKVVEVPDVGDQNAQLTGVSCVTADECTAVGAVMPYSSKGLPPIVERWDGSTWNAMQLPRPGKEIAFIDAFGVDCANSVRCVVVGYADGPKIGVTTWTGELDATSWTSGTIAYPEATSDQLYGISCPTASSCQAVGFLLDSEEYQHTLTEDWSGALFWRYEPTPAGPTWPVFASRATTSTVALRGLR